MLHNWVLWQLCDSAFPAGALIHSAGLEAAWQSGAVTEAASLANWVSAVVQQACHVSIPAVAAAWEGTPAIQEVDAFCDALLLNHVAHRASRAQGMALLLACEKSFGGDELGRLARVVRGGGMAGHFAPVFGAVGRTLEIPKHETCAAFAFMALRGAISSAVRLGIVGPLQGQNVQHRLAPRAAALVGACMEIPLESAVAPAPLCDLFQAAQDRLYSRLFVS